MKIGKRDDSLPPVDKNSPGFVLEQNEPNPFNPETIIHFTIPENIRLCEINLSISDLEGALVRELLKAYKPAGMYSVAWNGMDQAGRLVSCGVYFYRFRTPALSCTKKMVLLK
jgi:flagellar hook assembly protein FlgD